jgi:hypothetical protein
MIYAGLHNANVTNNYPMCDVVLQSHALDVGNVSQLPSHFMFLFKTLVLSCGHPILWQVQSSDCWFS